MKRSRRTTRIPDSHPGLFDAIDGAEPLRALLVSRSIMSWS